MMRQQRAASCGRPAAPPAQLPHALRPTTNVAARGRTSRAAAGASAPQQQQQQQQHQQQQQQQQPPQQPPQEEEAWMAFFEGLGMSDAASRKALRYSVRRLRDPYTAGAAIRWLKDLGPWQDADVTQRLILIYPEVLACGVETLQALVDELEQLGLSREQVQQLLWEAPGLLADFRDEQLPVIRRIVAARRGKYTNGASFAD